MKQERDFPIFLEDTVIRLVVSDEQPVIKIDALEHHEFPRNKTYEEDMVQAAHPLKLESASITFCSLHIIYEGAEIRCNDLIKHKDKLFQEMTPALRYVEDRVVREISQHLRKQFKEPYAFSPGEYRHIRHFLRHALFYNLSIVPESETEKRRRASDMETIRQYYFITKGRATRIGLDVSGLEEFEHKYLGDRK